MQGLRYLSVALESVGEVTLGEHLYRRISFSELGPTLLERELTLHGSIYRGDKEVYRRISESTSFEETIRSHDRLPLPASNHKETSLTDPWLQPPKNLSRAQLGQISVSGPWQR